MPRKFTTRSSAHKRKTGFRLGGKPSVLMLVILVAGFGVGYLMQINAASSKGSEIRKLESEISDLKETGGKMELHVAKEQSVKEVEAKVKSMGMVPTPNIEYVMATVPQVARK